MKLTIATVSILALGAACVTQAATAPIDPIARTYQKRHVGSMGEDTLVARVDWGEEIKQVASKVPRVFDDAGPSNTMRYFDLNLPPPEESSDLLHPIKQEVKAEPISFGSPPRNIKTEPVSHDAGFTNPPNEAGPSTPPLRSVKTEVDQAGPSAPPRTVKVEPKTEVKHEIKPEVKTEPVTQEHEQSSFQSSGRSSSSGSSARSDSSGSSASSGSFGSSTRAGPSARFGPSNDAARFNPPGAPDRLVSFHDLFGTSSTSTSSSGLSHTLEDRLVEMLRSAYENEQRPRVPGKRRRLQSVATKTRKIKERNKYQRQMSNDFYVASQRAERRNEEIFRMRGEAGPSGTAPSPPSRRTRGPRTRSRTRSSSGEDPTRS